jgi:hypothetical protein
VAEYVVICHFLEMPYGYVFTIIPQFPCPMGKLALFSLIGFPDGERLIAGRYYEDPDGTSWIQLPGRRIDIPPEIQVDALGLVAESDTTPCLN